MAIEDEEVTTGTLGIERWVQFAFIGGALAAFWMLDHIVLATWEQVADLANLSADPNPTYATAAAAILAIVGIVIAYKNPKINKFSNEVAAELSKVTWPTRKDTYAQTIVVVIVSVIAAIILGVFDAAWSSVTDLIYKV